MSDATVFIVDDDQAVARSLRWLIETVRLKVETFASAQAFLDGYDAAKPGCLVRDVRMPGMSGLELQERLAARTCRAAAARGGPGEHDEIADGGAAGLRGHAGAQGLHDPGPFVAHRDGGRALPVAVEPVEV